MERRRPGDRNIGSVKAAINMYGERILESSPALRNTQMNFPEVPRSSLLDEFFFLF